MESGMIIITGVLFTLILVPILLISLTTKKQSRILINGIRMLSSQDSGTISKLIEHNTFALGIDESKKALYFFKKTEGSETSKKIDLTQVRICEVIKTTTRVKKDRGVEEIVEKIRLCFIKKDNQPTEYLDLYDEDDSVPVNGELLIAENWKDLANQTISNKKDLLTKPFSVKAA